MLVPGSWAVKKGLPENFTPDQLLEHIGVVKKLRTWDDEPYDFENLIGLQSTEGKESLEFLDPKKLGSFITELIPRLIKK